MRSVSLTFHVVHMPRDALTRTPRDPIRIVAGVPRIVVGAPTAW